VSAMKPLAKRIPPAVVGRPMRDHWRLFLVEGIASASSDWPDYCSAYCRALCHRHPRMAASRAGAVGLFAHSDSEAPGFGWSLLSAFVALVAGGLLLWNPLQGLITLTYVLTTFFIVDGVLVIVLAIAHRRELTEKWEWMMVNGIIDLILAGIIIFGFPGTLIWAFGLLVGIDMIFGGAALVAMALEARKAGSHDGLV